jgi:hypothetical protein
MSVPRASMHVGPRGGRRTRDGGGRECGSSSNGTRWPRRWPGSRARCRRVRCCPSFRPAARGVHRPPDPVLLRLRGVGQDPGRRGGDRAGHSAGARAAAGRDHPQPAAVPGRAGSREGRRHRDLRPGVVYPGHPAGQGVPAAARAAPAGGHRRRRRARHGDRPGRARGQPRRHACRSSPG